MRVEIYVQARMGSGRLPGKVLKQVLGKPMLEYLMERLERCKEADAVYILTSTEPQDDAIVQFCKEKNYRCFRGDEQNVLDRYYQAAKKFSPDAVVRINGDCPLIDPVEVDRVINAFKKNVKDYDYVSNTISRSFPRGLDTEIFSVSALNKTHKQVTKEEEKEHVTLHMYRHPEMFRLMSVENSSDQSSYRWTLDTEDDFKLIKAIIEAIYPKKPNFGLHDILKAYENHPEWNTINAHVQQKIP